MQGPERGGGRQAPVSTVSTQCTEETNTKRQKGIFSGDRLVLYLDCSGHYMTMHL